MNARQRRKHKRAYPDRYWTQEEIDAVKARVEELRELFALPATADKEGGRG